MHSSDELQIDTPEQIALELPLAGVGSRFLAIALDTVLQVLVFGLLAAVLVGVSAGIGAGWLDRSFGSLAPAVVVVLGFCVYWGYFAIFETIWKGQTPGKRYTGIRVIKDSGRPINAFEAIARNLMRAVDGLPVLYGVGLVVMFISLQHRRLGDYVAGSVVVRERSAADLRPYIEAAPGSGAPAYEGSRVSPEELLLIETYLQRRHDLEPDVRLETAAEIATRIRRRVGVEAEPGQSADEFLEAVARRTRDGARFR